MLVKLEKVGLTSTFSRIVAFKKHDSDYFQGWETSGNLRTGSCRCGEKSILAQNPSRFSNGSRDESAVIG